MSEKLIALKILANGRYCNNDCPFMRPDAGSCQLFGSLRWEPKKKVNGNTRPSSCRKAEQLLTQSMDHDV